jgi:hypothetical protein
VVRSHKLSCHSGIAGTFTYWKLTGVLVGRKEVGGIVGCHEDDVRSHIHYCQSGIDETNYVRIMQQSDTHTFGWYRSLDIICGLS